MSKHHELDKLNCSCKEDQQKLHGSYYIWARKEKEKGKTITHSLKDEQAKQCLECTKNYKKM